MYVYVRLRCTFDGLKCTFDVRLWPFLALRPLEVETSLYQSACMLVSVSASLCVCLFLNSSETANPNELKF